MYFLPIRKGPSECFMPFFFHIVKIFIYLWDDCSDQQYFWVVTPGHMHMLIQVVDGKCFFNRQPKRHTLKIAEQMFS